MKLVLRLAPIALLFLAVWSYARPLAPEAPAEVYLEGVIDGTYFGTTPTILVNMVKVYIASDTVIRDYYGTVKYGSLKVGTKVEVYGYVAKGGVMARTIYVVGR